MTPEIHRAALRAAARLALSSLLVGCGSAATSPVDSTGADLSTGSGSASEDGTSADADAGCTPKKAAAEYCAAVQPDDTELDCCKAEVASADFPSDMKFRQTPDLRVDEVTRGCCAELMGDTFEPRVPELRTKCCDAIGFEGAAACTPWGPPMPPSMDWAPGAAERAVAGVLAA